MNEKEISELEEKVHTFKNFFKGVSPDLLYLLIDKLLRELEKEKELRKKLEEKIQELNTMIYR